MLRGPRMVMLCGRTPVSHRFVFKMDREDGMKISARNVFDGVVKEVRKGSTTAHVTIDVNGLIITASITNESVDDLALKSGAKVKAVIKSSDVIVAVD
jgi:molybdopterin-binding protein